MSNPKQDGRKKEEKLEIWNEVCKTDPKFTKNFKGKGGFSGTAVCAQWQKWKATQLWGPYGCQWGVKDDVFEVIKASDDHHYNLMFYRGSFYYPGGSFNIFAEMDMWTYSTKYKSWSKANDIHKKLSTDALTKGLSMLGFSADVFMGRFDDNKYVQGLKDDLQESKPDLPENKPEKPRNFDFLQIMKKLKAYLGEETYYSVLGGEGYEKANQVNSRDEQKSLFIKLQEKLEVKFDKNSVSLACIGVGVPVSWAERESRLLFKTDLPNLTAMQRAELIVEALEGV